MDYSCICCGTCCQKFQPWLTPIEVTKIASHLDITPEQFLLNYTDHRWPGTESNLLIQVNKACIFMQTGPQNDLSLCRIQEFKPACCRAWAAGTYKSECQAGLKNVLGIRVDSNSNLLATAEQLNLLAERMKIIQGL